MKTELHYLYGTLHIATNKDRSRLDYIELRENFAQATNGHYLLRLRGLSTTGIVSGPVYLHADIAKGMRDPKTSLPLVTVDTITPGELGDQYPDCDAIYPAEAAQKVVSGASFNADYLKEIFAWFSRLGKGLRIKPHVRLVAMNEGSPSLWVAEFGDMVVAEALLMPLRK